LTDLDRFDAGAVVDGKALLDAGILSKLEGPIKVLANGEITKALTVDVDKISRSASEKIQAAGGTVKE
jgi:large subunit ribosomal protein L15